MRVHERLHSGEKPFKCKTCDKCFTAAWGLRQHEKTHTGQKPYQCKTCNKCFSCSGNLQRHERSHTGVKPYGCKMCCKRYFDLKSYKTRSKRHCNSLCLHQDNYGPNNENNISASASFALKNDTASHDKTFTCWICQDELSGYSQLHVEHYDDHMK